MLYKLPESVVWYLSIIWEVLRHKYFKISFVLFSLSSASDTPTTRALHLVILYPYSWIFYSVCLLFFHFAFKFEKYPLSTDKPLKVFFISDNVFFIFSIYF